MNRYRVLPPLKVDLDDGRSFVQGDEFDLECSEEDEAWYLDHELLAIVPQRYRVIGESIVDDTAPGDEFEAAMTIGRQAQLVGSHLERVEPPAAQPTAEYTKPKSTVKKSKE